LSAADPPCRRLPSSDGDWRLSVSLGAQADATTFVFIQRLALPYDASSIGPGWHYYLDRLGAVVADATLPNAWDDYYPSLRDAYALPSWARHAASGDNTLFDHTLF
jgi:hypothetical protein